MQNGNGDRVKTLRTPQIILADQPNEIIVGKFESSPVEKYKDGKITITVNQNTPLEFKLSPYNKLSFISFSAIQENTIQEFFYKCNNGSTVEHAVETTTEQIVGSDEEQTTETTEETIEPATEQLSFSEPEVKPFYLPEMTYNSVDDDDD